MNPSLLIKRREESRGKNCKDESGSRDLKFRGRWALSRHCEGETLFFSAVIGQHLVIFVAAVLVACHLDSVRFRTMMILFSGSKIICLCGSRWRRDHDRVLDLVNPAVLGPDIVQISARKISVLYPNGKKSNFRLAFSEELPWLFALSWHRLWKLKSKFRCSFAPR